VAEPVTYTIALYPLGISRAPSVSMGATWDELVQTLSHVRYGECDQATCQRRRCPSRHGACWAPAFTAPPYASRCECDLRQRAWNPNTARCETCGSSYARPDRMGSSSISLLVLDVDDCSEAEMLHLRENLLRYRHLIHATHSDRPDNRCMRVVLPYSRPVTLLEDHAVREVLAAWGPFAAADRMSNNGRRVHYIASRPRGADFFLEVHDGEPLDVDGLLATPPPAITVPSTLEMPS
jgi:hypothetical protein